MTVNMDDIKDILARVEKPARYTGGEFGEVKSPPSPFYFCMAFPDLYEVGMSNLGIKIVAESFRRRGYAADFCFAPHTDFGDGLKAAGVPLYSLALKKPLAEFDMIGFSLQFELCYTNLLYMLDLAGIPLRREDRAGGRYPVIAIGGPCAVNPEPLADFIDIAFIGDGESVDADVAAIYLECGGATQEFYRRAAALDGVYVPALTRVLRGEDGRICGFEGDFRPRRAIVSDLDGAVFPAAQPVPNCESVFDRSIIEVMRGCYRGCRFCQAGFIYRPVRQRSVETLTRQACSLIASTGYDEVSLNSLSTGDYPRLRELIGSLKASLPCGVTLALPSLRVDSFDSDFAQDARKISLTFAPEAGSQRLRDVINKDIKRVRYRIFGGQTLFHAGASHRDGRRFKGDKAHRRPHKERLRQKAEGKEPASFGIRFNVYTQAVHTLPVGAAGRRGRSRGQTARVEGLPVRKGRDLELERLLYLAPGGRVRTRGQETFPRVGEGIRAGLPL